MAIGLELSLFEKAVIMSKMKRTARTELLDKTSKIYIYIYIYIIILYNIVYIVHYDSIQ